MNLIEVKEIKDKFLSKFKDSFSKAGNNLSVGFGNDNNKFTLEVRLKNDKLKSTLPEYYNGLKVNVKVIGEIKAGL